MCLYYIGQLLRRHENHIGLSRAISVTDQSCAAPISKVESQGRIQDFF